MSRASRSDFPLARHSFILSCMMFIAHAGVPSDRASIGKLLVDSVAMLMHSVMRSTKKYAVCYVIFNMM